MWSFVLNPHSARQRAQFVHSLDQVAAVIKCQSRSQRTMLPDNPYHTISGDQPFQDEVVNAPWSGRRVAYMMSSMLLNGMTSLCVTTYLFVPLSLMLHLVVGEPCYGQFGMVVFTLAPVAFVVGLTSGFLWLRHQIVGSTLFVGVTLALVSPTIDEFAGGNWPNFFSLLIILGMCFAASIATVLQVAKYANEKYQVQLLVDKKRLD